jgi:hypothetical protein
MRIAASQVSSIGLLREGPLHAAIKSILVGPGDRFEVPIGNDGLTKLVFATRQRVSPDRNAASEAGSIVRFADVSTLHRHEQSRAPAGVRAPDAAQVRPGAGRSHGRF